MLLAKTERIGTRSFGVSRPYPVGAYLAVSADTSAPKKGRSFTTRREGMFEKLTRRAIRAARAELHTRRTPSVAASLVRDAGEDCRIRSGAVPALGHAVIGDIKYHPAEASERRIARVALHADHLRFIHPRSGDSVPVDCEVPPDFQSLLQALSPSTRGRR